VLERVQVLTRPECGHRTLETMPTDICQWNHASTGCGALLWPGPGDCCVVCASGSEAGPAAQMHGEPCGGREGEC
jgi:hypothetical protein